MGRLRKQRSFLLCNRWALTWGGRGAPWFCWFALLVVARGLFDNFAMGGSHPLPAAQRICRPLFCYGQILYAGAWRLTGPLHSLPATLATPKVSAFEALPCTPQIYVVFFRFNRQFHGAGFRAWASCAKDHQEVI